jgi:ABC-2 type transport system permease protein
MRLYYEVAVRAFRRATTYRLAAFSGLITNSFFGAMLSAIYLAVYGGRASMAGYTPGDAISYLWAAQSMISLGGAWLSWSLVQGIRSGDVAIDLMRPWNYYAYWVSRELGERAFNLLGRGVLTYAAGMLLFGARLPATQDLPGLVISLMLAVLISCAFSFLINATAFWLLDNSGLMNIGSIVTMFFSGFLIPLAFFPPWLEALAQLLPFQAITGLPIQIFLGKLRGMDLAAALALQLFWAVALTGLALLQMRAAMHKVVIQGG